MNIREKAEVLAIRPYIVMTTVDETTDGELIYFARILEAEGCFGQGETRDKALEDLHLALVDYIESLLEDGLPIPEPAALVSSRGNTVDNTITLSGHGKNVRRKETNPYQDTYILTTV